MLTERAIAQYLRSQAAYLIAAVGTYILTEEGLHITLSSGFEFDLLILRGQDNLEIEEAAVIAYCSDCQQPVSMLRTLNHVCEVRVSLRFPADDNEAQPDVLAALEHASGQLVKALYRSELKDRLSSQETGFSVLHVGPWRQQSGWTGRQRTYAFSTLMVCTLSDVGDEVPA
jgi:hypothetical protein